MKKKFGRYWLVVIFAVAGVLAGYIYWRFVGCRSGSCPITSNWYTSALMGGFIGYLTGDSVMDFRQRKTARHERTLE